MRFDSLVQRLLPASASRALRRKSARRAARQALAGRHSILESLEARMVLTTFYVDASLFLTADRDSSGGLTAGDQVTFGQGQTYQQANLTYNAAPAAGDAGTAFRFIGEALASPLVRAGDTIDVAGGTYTNDPVVINKSLTLQGLGHVVLRNVWSPPSTVFVPPPGDTDHAYPLIIEFPGGSGSISGGIGIEITGGPDMVTLANLDIEGYGSSLSCDGCGTLNLTDLKMKSIPLAIGGPFPRPTPRIANVRDLNLTSTTNTSQIVNVSSENWFSASHSYVSLFDQGDRLEISGVSHLSVTTGGGDDIFNITPLPSTAIIVNGSDPTPPFNPGDSLNLNLAGVSGASLAVSNDALGSSGSWTFANRQPVIFKNFETLTPSAASIEAKSTVNATEGVDTGSQVLTRFSDPNGVGLLSDYSASIDWGDGVTTTGVVSLEPGVISYVPAPFAFDPTPVAMVVSGSHAYLEDGNHTIIVTVHRNGYEDMTMSANAIVAEPPFQGIGLTLVGTAGVPFATEPDGGWGVVARFTHGNGSESFSDPGAATIDWGDGTTSTGTVGRYPANSLHPGEYGVSAAHAYGKTGQYTIEVTVYDDGNPTIITSTVKIGDPFLLPGSLGTSNQRFVAAVFSNLLHRKIDAEGLQFWSAKLDGGASREEIVAGIQNSAEYRHGEINALFQTYLHRDADAAVLDADNNLLLQGQTLEQLAAIIVGSDEYFQQRGGGSNDGFLTALFQDVLHRGIEDGAKRAFEQMLSHGATRAQIADLVFGSREFRNFEVQNLYQQAFGRDAEGAAENYWVDKLAHGERDEQVLAEILGAQEFFDKIA